MYHQHPFAQRERGIGRHHHPYMLSHQRAAVNIYKTDTSVEVMVFAPGRIKENFQVNAKGNELIISYTPAPGIPAPDWLKKEYSRGAFERSFTLDDTIDTSGIKASYIDGVLQVSLPVIPGKEIPKQEIPVN
jgi:HSP20 family protein